MNNQIRWLLSLAAIATLFLLVAGCTQVPVLPGTPTQVATPIPTAQPVGMGIPGPTQTLPPQYSLTFQITSNGNTANPIQYVALSGGNGMNFVSQIQVVLTQPDGSQQNQSMVQPLSMGQNVQFPCSTSKNRIEIYTTAPTVGTIKVYDEIVPFQSLNP